MTVVGTRPEIIRLAAVIRKLDSSEAFDHVLVHTGQNYDYELNEIFFEDLGLRRPDYFLEAAGATAIETIGQCMVNIDGVFAKENPDAFLVLGDTNSALCAITAKKRHIPVFHMEAGNRCFDQRVPEETNRRIVDHIADVNLTYSDISRECLLAEGLPAATSIKTGSPMMEVLAAQMPKIERSDVLSRLGLTRGEYFVVSVHREENVEGNFDGFCAVLESLAANFKLPVVVTTHPRTRKKIERLGIRFSELIRLEKPFGLNDYIRLQMDARAVLSDSGTISEESSILNFRALNLREAHERHEAMEEASVMMTGLNPERVMQGLVQLADQNIDQRNFRPVADYSMPNVSDKVLRIILSYTDYVRRTVWGETNANR